MSAKTNKAEVEATKNEPTGFLGQCLDGHFVLHYFLGMMLGYVICLLIVARWYC